MSACPVLRERERLGYSRKDLARAMRTTVAEVHEWEAGALVRESMQARLVEWVESLTLYVEGHAQTWEALSGVVGMVTDAEAWAEGGGRDLEALRSSCPLKVEELDLLMYLYNRPTARQAKTVLECAAAGLSGDLASARAVADSVRARLHLLQRRGLVARPADPARVRAEAFHTTPAGRARVRLEFVVLSARGESP